MDKLISIKSKLQAYKSLPQAEYRVIAEHLLPDVQAVIDELEQYKEAVRKEWEQKHLNAIFSKAENGKYFIIESGGYRYTSNITKEPVK